MKLFDNFHRQIHRVLTWVDHKRFVELREILILISFFIVLLFGYGFLELADEVSEGSTQAIDEFILRKLRRSDDPAVPVGPAWLREAGLDITALGSPVIMILLVIFVSGLLAIQQNYSGVILALGTTSVGSLVAVSLKYLLGRDRPSVVPHLREVTTPSFPSGHTMVSAIVFMTLGILLMSFMKSRKAKLYCLFWALLMTFLVGLSRIYLGVHYPTDVLAGWLAGVAWALASWLFVQWARRRKQLTSLPYQSSDQCQH